MLMFLTILAMSLLALLACVAAFSLAARADAEIVAQPENRPADEPQHFFAPLPRAARPPQVPLDVLLSQIDRHVRLERAAAEAFLEVPSLDALHSRTGSPLLN